MSTSVNNKSFRLSSLPPKVEEDEAAPKLMENQGIVSILGSDCEQPKAAASFRRTLSADMSSTKWLAQNGFRSPMMKKIASSEQLAIISAVDSSSSSSEDEEEEEEFEGKIRKGVDQNRRQVDVWSSIISQNKSQELPPPYVHPLVKKSSSSLSEKSLEICTESLGSETGSEGFSSYPPSETGSVDADDFDKVVEEVSQPQQQQQEEKDQYSQCSTDWDEVPSVAKYNYSAATKKVQPRSFPPSLPSLTRRSSEGQSLHIHSHRENGRLVLEAVSVPTNKNFHAQRQDGRLLLTLFNTPPSYQEQPNHDEAVVLHQKKDEVEEEFEEVFAIFEKEEVTNVMEKDDEEEEVEEEEMNEEVEKDLNEPQDMGIVMEQAVPKMTSGVINVHRSALMMKKLMGLGNKNPTWSHKFNCTAAKSVEIDPADVEEERTPLPQSLPPRPRVARLIPSAPAGAAASFNAYEYFWRTKPLAASLKNPLIHQCLPLKNNSTIKSYKPKSYEQKELAVLRSCKEARRSLLSWKRYCIATS